MADDKFTVPFKARATGRYSEVRAKRRFLTSMQRNGAITWVKYRPQYRSWNRGQQTSGVTTKHRRAAAPRQH